MNNEGKPGPTPGGAARPQTGPPRRPTDKPFIPFARFEDIVARCGHVEKFGLLPDGKDRFRADRRKKALDRDCKACREKKQVQEQEAAEARRLEKAKRAAENAPAEKSAGPQTSRLPDGSRFEVRYDAAKEEWSGTLTVPAAEGTPVTLTGSQSGLFPLLSHLDKQYRATLSPPGTHE